MKYNLSLSGLALACLALLGCQQISTDGLLQAGSSAMRAATLSDAEVRQVADEACTMLDQENTIAPAKSTYSQRLAKIAKSLGNDVDGVKVNYKVYLTKDVNAWAMANGCIRVYSGLMDLMTDNEVEGVLGHEMGHVALGHSRKALQTAYAASAARDLAAASSNDAVSALSRSQLGALSEALVNAQFSQSQESDADNFSYEFLKKRNVNTSGLASAFEKLAAQGGSEGSMFSSHPDSQKRADTIRQRIAADRG
ncbi:Metalloprotease LoiP precursor [compost metagenome]